MRLVLMCVALFVTTSLVSQEQPKKPQHSSATSNATQPDNGQPDPVIAGSTNIDTKPENQTRCHEAQQSSTEPHDWIDKTNAISTAVMAAFTAALFAFVVLQLRAYKRKERAWIMVDLDSIPAYSPSGGFTDGNTFADIRLVCRNDGSTPGWITEIQAALAVMERTAKPPSIDARSEKVFTGPMPIGIGRESEPIDFTLSIDKSPGLGEHVVIYGTVKYRHAFRKRATTTFAYASSGGPWKRLDGHSEYNTHT